MSNSGDGEPWNTPTDTLSSALAVYSCLYNPCLVPRFGNVRAASFGLAAVACASSLVSKYSKSFTAGIIVAGTVGALLVVAFVVYDYHFFWTEGVTEDDENDDDLESADLELVAASRSDASKSKRGLSLEVDTLKLESERERKKQRVQERIKLRKSKKKK